MPNEQNLNEGSGASFQPDAATTPIDLAAAFRAINQSNREAAQEPVGNGEAGSEDDPGTGSEPAGDAEVGEQPADSAAKQGGGELDGGSSDSIEAIDFNAYKQDLLRKVQRNAQIEVTNEFKKDNIGYYSAAELTVRDEKTGRVRYRNPDVSDEHDPDYYFKSRSDMMDYVNSWNQGVDFEWRKAVNQKQMELLQEEAPKARLMDFFPKWQAMDDATRKILDVLLEGHEVYDKDGKEIGYNVDLNAVAAQAERIVSSAQIKQEPKQEPQQNTAADQVASSGGPALDMQTGNGKSEDGTEPTNIGEALKKFDKMNRSKK